MSRLTRTTNASTIMFGLVEEYLTGAGIKVGCFGNASPFPPGIEETPKDLFVLLYSTVRPEILPGDDPLTKAILQIVETPSFETIRAMTVLNPSTAAMGMLSLYEILELQLTDGRIAPAVESASGDLTVIADFTKKIEELTKKDEDDSVVGEVSALSQKRIALAATIRENPRLLELFKAFGRVEKIQSDLLDDTIDSSTTASTVDLGDDIGLADTGYLVTRTPEMIAQDLADGTLEVTSGEEDGGDGLGPVLVMLDTSGSMRRRIEDFNRCDLALATAFGLMESCRESGRRFVVAPFTSSVDRKRIVRSNDRGVCDLGDLQRLLKIQPRGGTGFLVALTAATEILEEEGMKNADVVWLTDGAAEATERTPQSFERTVAKKKEFDEKGVRSFVLNYCTSGYIMRILAGAGPDKSQLGFGMSTIPESDHKSRLYENMENIEELEKGVRFILKDIADRGTGLDWLKG
jgi:hypothetical protein